MPLPPAPLLRPLAFAAALVVSASAARAQAIASPDLPDAPSTVTADAYASSSSVTTHTAAQDATSSSPAKPRAAGRFDKYIDPGQTAPALTFGNTFVLGLKDAFSPYAAIGWGINAGYEQLVNGSPNYGQTGRGFAQRLGAAAARDASEGVFSDSILSPLLHEDPRYYRMGPGKPILKRLVYAGTRGLITRTNGGHSTINIANIAGNFAGSALTQAYYPDLNRGINQILQTFGGSVGGSALSFVSTEFLSETLEKLHLIKTKE